MCAGVSSVPQWGWSLESPVTSGPRVRTCLWQVGSWTVPWNNYVFCALICYEYLLFISTYIGVLVSSVIFIFYRERNVKVIHCLKTHLMVYVHLKLRPLVKNISKDPYLRFDCYYPMHMEYKCSEGGLKIL